MSLPGQKHIQTDGQSNRQTDTNTYIHTYKHGTVTEKNVLFPI